MSQLPTNLSVEDDEEEEQLRVPNFGDVTGAMMDALARSRRRQRSQMTDVMMDARNNVLKQSQDFAGAIKDQLEQELPEGQDRVTEPGTMTRVQSMIVQAQKIASPFEQIGLGRDRAGLLGKSFLRMGVQLQTIPLTAMEGAALNMRKAFERVTGRFLPVGSFEERILRTRDELTKLTTGDAWLAPKVQDRIWAWDDGDWWVERAGEQAAILFLTMGAGWGAGSIAGAATSRLALIEAIRVGAAVSTTAMIEGGLAQPEFQQGLMARGFTRSEAREVSQLGAAAVGIVNGFLDIAPLDEFLNKGVGRGVIMRAFIGMAKEAGTEFTQEGVQIIAERRLKINEPGTALERMMAAGSVGLFAGGGVSTLSTLLAEPLTPAQQRAKDRTELLRSDVRIIEAPKPIADVKVDTPEDVQATRQEIILQGEPRSDEQQEMLEATELQSPRALKQEITDFTSEELTQTREAFEDIIDSGLNPFTGSVMTAAEQAEMLLLIDDITEIRDTVEAMPSVEEAVQVQTEELPDGQPSKQIEAAPAPEAAVVPTQARQETEEAEGEQVAQAQQEQDENAPEPIEPVAEDLKGPLTQEQQVRKLTRASFDRVVGVAQGTALQETGARIGQLSQQVADMLFEGNARRAGRLEPELEAAKAQAIRDIDDLGRLHGDQGGLFDDARRWVRARGDSATAAVERLVNAVRNLGSLQDFDARVVEVDPESSKGVIQREVMEIGLQLSYWESDTNVDIAGFHDRYGTGRRILINIEATDDEVLKTVIAHEMVHALQMSSQVAFERFYQRINVVDPEGLRNSGKRYWDSLTRGQATVEIEFDRWFVSAEGKSESVALYVQERATDTNFYNKVLGTDRNLVTAFRDIIRRILNALRLTSADVAVLFEMDQLASAAHDAFQKPPDVPVQVQEEGELVAAAAEGRPSFALALAPKQVQALVDEADVALPAEAAEAITRFVGHEPLSRDADEIDRFGIMDASAIEEAFAPSPKPRGAKVAEQLEAAFAPVRERLRATFGDTVLLFRFQAPLTGNEAPRNVLSWTKNRTFAERLAGATRDNAALSDEVIDAAVAEFAEKGEVKVGRFTYRTDEEFGGTDIFDDRMGHITGIDPGPEALRKSLVGERDEILEGNAEKQRLRDKVAEAEIPLDDVVWVTDRAGQQEYIVRSVSKPAQEALVPSLPPEQQQQIIDQVNGSFAFRPRPRGKQGETLRRVEAVAGVKKDTMTDKDMKQLRKVLRAQQKAADIGFRGGVVNAQSKVLNVLEGVFGKMGLDVTERMIVRMQKARAARSPQQVAREGIRLMEGKIRLVRHQLREDIRANRVSVSSIKRQVQEAVTNSLKGPIGVKMQGRFLGDVRKAESPAGLLRALRRIDRAIGQVRHREAVADLRKVQRKLKSFRPITNQIRADSALELTKARPHAVTDKNRVQTFKTREEYDEATVEIVSAVDEIERMMSDRRLELKNINADKERTVQGHIDRIVNNIQGTPSATTPGVRIGGIKQLKGRSKMLQDIQSGLFKGLKLWHYDAANLTRHLEGKWDGDGVLTALLDKTPKEVEEAYLSGRRDETDSLDRMIRESAVGSINLSDAQARMSGSLGEANQEFVNVVIGGETVTLSTDIVAELVAIDDRTVLGVVEQGFQPEGAREREAFRPTLVEIQAIRQKWGPRFGGLIQGMKANLEVLKPQSYAVTKELTGTEPESEPEGYWPSHRNLRANPDFGKPEDLKAFNQSAARRYAENLGFLKARTGGKAPFIMRGLISNYLDHVDNSLKLIHLAITTRNAASVIMNPEVVQAINAAHGKAANEYLQGHLVEISRLNEDVDGGPNATLRATNSNLAGSWILTNVGTFIRQLGGISKIAAVMTSNGDFKWFLVGIKKLRPGTYQEMKDNSGVMWDRYEGDSAARYSSFRGQGLSGMDFAGFRQSLGGFLRSAKQMDGRSSRRSWTAMMRSIKFLDWFDSISARLAWEGYKAKAQSLNPKWSEQQVMKQTALDTGNVVRNSQNTSSPLDSAGLAMRLRNNPMRVFLLFTTDPNKSLNMLVRGLHQGPKQGFYAATGVLGNVLWSSFAVTGILQIGGDLAASAIAAALGRDIDEKEREKQRQRSYERAWIRMASEVFGLWFFGDTIVGAWEGTFSPFKRADVLRSPVGEVLADVANGIGDATRAVTDLLDEGKITEGEMTEFWRDVFQATLNLANAAAAMVGNPFLTPYYRVRPIVRQLSQEAVENSGQLKSSKPEL